MLKKLINNIQYQSLMMHLYEKVCHGCSTLTTEVYSTSFSSAIKLLHPDLRQHIHNIYGFVRFADEIVDTFHQYNKQKLLIGFKEATYDAIEQKVSINPILHSFQSTVNKYDIDLKLVDAFLYSMEMDLSKTNHDELSYGEYIYGSAEVVGLMCLYVFCEGNTIQYNNLKPAAQHLGAAFQKVNFLRDIKADYEGLNRIYFPGCDFTQFTIDNKLAIEKDIDNDFTEAYKGIQKLPIKSKFGVYVAYKYYQSLFQKIKEVDPKAILQTRIRIPNYNKAYIVAVASIKKQLKLI